MDGGAEAAGQVRLQLVGSLVLGSLNVTVICSWLGGLSQRVEGAVGIYGLGSEIRMGHTSE